MVAPFSSTATPKGAATARKDASTPPRRPSTSCSTSRCWTRPGRSRSAATTTSSSTRSPDGTRLRLGLTITETTVAAVPYIAGIDTGWSQVLDNLATALSQRKGMIIMSNSTGRRVTANLSLTLDGRYNGPGGPG